MQWPIVLLVAGLAVYADAADCTGCGTIKSIEDVVSNLTFTSACKAYKTTYDCYGGKKCDTKDLDAAVSGLCQTGSDQLNSCGSQINTCVVLLQKANTEDDKKHTCNDFMQFNQCTYKAGATCDKNQKITDLMDKLRTQIDELDMEVGCDGACASAVAGCLNDLADDATSANITTKKVQDMCAELNNANKCIEPLKKKECSKGIANVKLAEDIITKQKNSISDICGNDGKPTECAKDFEACGVPLKTITGKSTNDQCHIISLYLTCVERLPCKNVFKDVVKKSIQTMNAAELQAKCPVIGGCKDRLMTCANRASTELKGVDKKTNLDQFCSIGGDIEACFNVVRGDSSCKLEDLEIDEIETTFFADLGAECGNKTACHIQFNKCTDSVKNVTPSTPQKEACSLYNKAALCMDSTVRSDTCVRVQKEIEPKDKNFADVLKKQCGHTICPGCSATPTSVNDAITSLKFKDACVVYKSSYDCYEKKGCSVDGLNNAVTDVCQVGTSQMTRCGTQMNQCMSELLGSQSAAAGKNAKTTCSDMKDFYKCTFDAAARCTNENITNTIEKMRTQISELEMETGCDGKCALAVSTCLSNLTNDATTGKGMNFKDMCIQLNHANECIAPLKATACSKGQANLQLAETMITQQKEAVSDVCEKDGQPTECVTEYNKCRDLLKDIKKTQSVSEQCKTIATFLECAANAPCHNTIEDTIKQQISMFDDAETKAKCPTVGTCKDRILTCTTNANELSKTNDHDKLCKIGAEIDTCFAVIKKDPNCKRENVEIDSQEKEIKALVTKECGDGSSSVAVKSSVLLIVLAFMANLLR